MLKTLVMADTTLWGRTLIAETAGKRNHELTAVGTDCDGYAKNYTETTEEEWMKNFS